MKKEKGASLLIESAIIIPIVIILIVFLIFAGLYMIQVNHTYAINYNATYVASRSVKNQQIIDSFIDGDGWATKIDGGEFVKSSYGENARSFPFPYLFFSSNVDYSKITEISKKEATKLLPAALDNTVTSCELEKHFLDTKVKCVVSYRFKPLNFLKYLDRNNKTGFSNKLDNLNHDNEVYNNIVNPTEFIRNIDFGFDIYEKMDDKMGISNKIKGILEKITNFVGFGKK